MATLTMPQSMLESAEFPGQRLFARVANVAVGGLSEVGKGTLGALKVTGSAAGNLYDTLTGQREFEQLAAQHPYVITNEQVQKIKTGTMGMGSRETVGVEMTNLRRISIMGAQAAKKKGGALTEREIDALTAEVMSTPQYQTLEKRDQTNHSLKRKVATGAVKTGFAAAQVGFSALVGGTIGLVSSVLITPLAYLPAKFIDWMFGSNLVNQIKPRGLAKWGAVALGGYTTLELGSKALRGRNHNKDVESLYRETLKQGMRNASATPAQATRTVSEILQPEVAVANEVTKDAAKEETVVASAKKAIEALSGHSDNNVALAIDLLDRAMKGKIHPKEQVEERVHYALNTLEQSRNLDNTFLNSLVVAIGKGDMRSVETIIGQMKTVTHERPVEVTQNVVAAPEAAIQDGPKGSMPKVSEAVLQGLAGVKVETPAPEKADKVFGSGKTLVHDSTLDASAIAALEEIRAGQQQFKTSSSTISVANTAFSPSAVPNNKPAVTDAAKGVG